MKRRIEPDITFLILYLAIHGICTLTIDWWEFYGWGSLFAAAIAGAITGILHLIFNTRYLIK